MEFFTLLQRHQLGRKRILDTMCAASLKSAGVRKLITNNRKDFQNLGEFDLVSFND